MSIKVDKHPQLLIDRSDVIHEEFYSVPISTGNTLTFGHSGSTITMVSGGRSVLGITTTNIVNNFNGVRTANPLFHPENDRPTFFASKISYTNQAGDNGFVAGGLASTLTLPFNTTTAASNVSFSGAMIYKLASDTGKWNLVVSNGSTKSAVQSNVSAGDGSYTLELSFNNFDGQNCEVVPYVNGVQLTDTTGRPIKQKIAYAALLDQYAMVGTGAGSSNSQTINVDYISGGQIRSGL